MRELIVILPEHSSRSPLGYPSFKPQVPMTKVQFPVSKLADRLLLSCSLHIVVYLGLVYLVRTDAPGLAWLRWATAVAAFIPFHFWLVNEVIASNLQELQSSRRWSTLTYLV